MGDTSNLTADERVKREVRVKEFEAKWCWLVLKFANKLERNFARTDQQFRKSFASLTMDEANREKIYEYIEKYGADALRMALVVGNTPGTAMALAEDKIKAYKHFANKLWNISRFILSYAPDAVDAPSEDSILKEFQELCQEVTTDLDNYRFHLASEKIYHYVWHRLADEILEESKAILTNPGDVADSRRATLRLILADSLKLLHPFMPFVTEELWQIGKFSANNSLLLIEAWPTKK